MFSYKTLWMFFVIKILALGNILEAKAGDDWITYTIGELFNVNGTCINPPTSSDFQSGSVNIDLSQLNQWKPSQVTVQADKLLKINWNTSNLTVNPSKYLVLYRIDPRFTRPQVFIQSYNYASKTYSSDLHSFNNGALINTLNSTTDDFQNTITQFNNYVNFNGRNQISANDGDVINIKLIDNNTFFSAVGSSFTNEFSNSNYPLNLLYTTSAGISNGKTKDGIIYSNITPWCNGINNPTGCTGSTYKSTTYPYSALVGDLNESGFNTLYNNINGMNPCASGLNSRNLNSLCLYDQGRGMQVTFAGNVIKDEATPFNSFIPTSSSTNSYFLYHKATSDGALDFLTSWDINGMFVKFGSLQQFMSSWSSYTTYQTFLNYINGYTQQIVNPGPNQAQVNTMLATINTDTSNFSTYLSGLYNNIQSQASALGTSIYNNVITSLTQGVKNNFLTLVSTTVTDINNLISVVNNINNILATTSSTQYSTLYSSLSAQNTNLNNYITAVTNDINSINSTLTQYGQQSYATTLNLSGYTSPSSNETSSMANLLNTLNFLSNNSGTILYNNLNTSNTNLQNYVEELRIQLQNSPLAGIFLSTQGGISSIGWGYMINTQLYIIFLQSTLNSIQSSINSTSSSQYPTLSATLSSINPTLTSQINDLNTSINGFINYLSNQPSYSSYINTFNLNAYSGYANAETTSVNNFITYGNYTNQVSSQLTTLQNNGSTLNTYLNTLISNLNSNSNTIANAVANASTSSSDIQQASNTKNNFLSLTATLQTQINSLISALNTFNTNLNATSSSNFSALVTLLSNSLNGTGNTTGISTYMAQIASNITSLQSYFNSYGLSSYVTSFNLPGYSPLSTSESTDINSLITYINNNPITYIDIPNTDLSMNFLHFGRYFMQVEVGNGSNVVTMQDLNGLTVEYYIATNGHTPTSSETGNIVQLNDDFSINPSQTGTLWFRVINTNPNLSGTVNINYASYIGSTIFSEIINQYLVTPIKQQFFGLTEIFYGQLTSDITLINISKILITLYVALYGFLFLIGMVQLTTQDLIVRVVKIAIVVTLFSNQSWEFFNENLFSFFWNGIDDLMNKLTGYTSALNNSFGFIDPVFSRYTNLDIWKMLFLQLFQWQYPVLPICAIMIIYSLGMYLFSLIEVIVGYLMAFIILAVMIGLAPLFIMLVLFERTRGIFEHWLGSLVNYLLQPAILLLFFLLIDQLIGDQLINTMVPYCWGCLIPLVISLSTIVDTTISFSLPFLPCLFPFFVAQIDSNTTVAELVNSTNNLTHVASSTFLFFTYCLVAKNMVSYVTQLTASLTNTEQASIEGQYTKSESLASSVVNDINNKITKPVVKTARSVAYTAGATTYRAGVTTLKAGYIAGSKGYSAAKKGGKALYNRAFSKPKANDDLQNKDD